MNFISVYVAEHETIVIIIFDVASQVQVIMFGKLRCQVMTNVYVIIV